MCDFCERAEKWEQPPLPGVSGNAVTGRVAAGIYDYKTTPPELQINDPGLAKKLWGGGNASIHIRIQYCPMCGRKLGS